MSESCPELWYWGSQIHMSCQNRRWSRNTKFSTMWKLCFICDIYYYLNKWFCYKCFNFGFPFFSKYRCIKKFILPQRIGPLDKNEFHEKHYFCIMYNCITKMICIPKRKKQENSKLFNLVIIMYPNMLFKHAYTFFVQWANQS